MSRIIWIKIIANKSRHSCQGLHSPSLIQRIITRKSCLHLLISSPNPNACNQYKMKWNDQDNQDIQPGNVPSRFPTSDHKLFCNDSMSSTLGMAMLRTRERKYYGTDKAKQIWQRASFIANISDCVWIVSFFSASEGPSAVSSVAKNDGDCLLGFLNPITKTFSDDHAGGQSLSPFALFHLAILFSSHCGPFGDSVASTSLIRIRLCPYFCHKFSLFA